MPAAKTTTDLLSAVRLDGALPDVDGRFGSTQAAMDSSILDLAAQELSTSVADVLISLRQERWVRQQTDVQIAAGINRYRIPARALAAGVSDLTIVDGGTEYDLSPIDTEDRFRFSDGRKGNWRAPYGYTWEGDCILLVPTPMETKYTLRVRYPRQPSRLVTVANCAAISSLTGTVLTIVAGAPVGWSSITMDIDVISGTTHGDVLEDDVTVVTNAGPTTMTRSSGTFALTGPDAILGTGNNYYRSYVCVAGTSCIIPIPESVYPLLVAATVRRCQEVCGDDDALVAAERAYARAEKRVRNMLEPRNRGGREMLTNPYSALRGGRFPGWRA